jgi:glucosamine--fructose-6-phosphate aminotransferase (isomerizing)
MCGIVGILGKKPVAEDLIRSLKRLEYRGYDSAGIATVHGGRLDRRRAAGKLGNLEVCVASEPIAGNSGIGHTRWATHGAPTERNAHPHTSAGVAVVHNGIIENFRELRQELEAGGAVFATETDTEVIVHLIERERQSGAEPDAAVATALQRLQGAFALAILFAGEGDLMIGARRGSPLAAGHGDGENYLGSDALALAPFTDRVTYLEDGDMAVLTRSSIRVYDENGVEVSRPM